VVPPEVEYEEPPRGRVGYDKREERYWLRADRCILKEESACAPDHEGDEFAEQQYTNGERRSLSMRNVFTETVTRI
jgi:hypothetical protein